MLRFFIVTFLFLSAVLVANAQMPADFKQVDVNQMSDEQIASIREEIEKKGMSIDEALKLAELKGASQMQLANLRQRLMQVGSEREVSVKQDVKTVEQEAKGPEKKTVTMQADLPLFGFDLFNRENLNFSPSIGGAVSDNYTLGPGDEITIDVWGISEQQYVLPIGRDGKIAIPHAGQLMLKGVSFGEAQKRIIRKLSRIYSDLDSDRPQTFVNVNLSSLRTITVNIVGEVFHPGTYTLNGLSTLFNALYYAGGPNESGSFRKIDLVRSGKTIASLDVYDYLVYGKSQVNVHLQDNDMIFVPPFTNRVFVQGAVKRSGRFETLEGETMQELLTYAGGFSPEAYERSVHLVRKGDVGKVMKSIEADFYDSFIMRNGDQLQVDSIIDRFDNRVSIEGAVFRPGAYELSDQLSLSALIKQAEGVREDAFKGRALLSRLKEDMSREVIAFNVTEVLNGRGDLLLQREDQVLISSIFDLEEEKNVVVEGEVQNPGEYPFAEGMSLVDLLILSGGLKESASGSYIEVSRRLSYEEASEFSEVAMHVHQFSIDRDLSLNAEAKDYMLQAFDKVLIKRLPSFNEGRQVRLAGEVKYPGLYSLEKKDDRLSALIKRAGGFSPYAYPEGGTLIRKESEVFVQGYVHDRIDEVDKDVEVKKMAVSVVAINLEKALKNEGGAYDLILEDGDELIIPEINATISIHGEVLNPHIDMYTGGRVKKYVSQSGGFTTDAIKRKTYVVHANGDAARTKNYLLFKRYPKLSPGSKVYVPKKTERERDRMSVGEWIALSSSFVTLSLSVVSLVTLINK